MIREKSNRIDIEKAYLASDLFLPVYCVFTELRKPVFVRIAFVIANFNNDFFFSLRILI